VGRWHGRSRRTRRTRWAHLVEAAYRSALKEGGFIEGQNVAIGHHSRLPALAADLVSRNVAFSL
jgi:hypothetical protein